jgi:hypothetical protein
MLQVQTVTHVYIRRRKPSWWRRIWLKLARRRRPSPPPFPAHFTVGRVQFGVGKARVPGRVS